MAPERTRVLTRSPGVNPVVAMLETATEAPPAPEPAAASTTPTIDPAPAGDPGVPNTTPPAENPTPALEATPSTPAVPAPVNPQPIAASPPSAAHASAASDAAAERGKKQVNYRLDPALTDKLKSASIEYSYRQGTQYSQNAIVELAITKWLDDNGPWRA